MPYESVITVNRIRIFFYFFLAKCFGTSSDTAVQEVEQLIMRNCIIQAVVHLRVIVHGT